MISIEIIVQAELDKIKAQLPGRTARVSSALRNSVFNVTVILLFHQQKATECHLQRK